MQTLKTHVINVSLLFPRCSVPFYTTVSLAEQAEGRIDPPAFSSTLPGPACDARQQGHSCQNPSKANRSKPGNAPDSAHQSWGEANTEVNPPVICTATPNEKLFFQNTNITYNHRENPAGLLASYFLIQLWIIKLKTLQKRLKALVSRSLKNVQKNT